jgi:predicted nuclease of restriction endonuclease-like (RecB) superfamily
MSKQFIKKHDEDFSAIHQLINKAKIKAFQQINNTLISLYWNIGEYISKKVAQEKWGKNVVEELAKFLQLREPSIKGFSARNLWRMKQFFETYKDNKKLSTVLTEITWSNHLHILSQTKSIQEKEFYLQLAAHTRYSARDFSRIIDTATYERTAIANKKLSTVLTEFPVSVNGVFKDSYMFEFIGIYGDHKEPDLRRALVKNLKKFLLELGPDFNLMGEEYVLQVGMKDFRVDLLMHHRGLNCIVAIELKTTDFQPAHLGQLQFYLEALDKDIKKPHENPSIGILICKTKDEEVVKYALSRNISPAMISEYETQLINKKVLQEKLHELTKSLTEDNSEAEGTEQLE